MPNHVTHRLIITAPSKDELDAFLAAIEGPESEEVGRKAAISFDRIIPMPEAIKRTESSSVVVYGLALLDRLELHNPVFLPKQTADEYFEELLTYKWVKDAGVTTVDELKAHLREKFPDAEAKGRAAIAAYEATGHIDWYSWAIDKWGTKWDAYSIDLSRNSDTEAELKFDTAWSVPTPVFVEILKTFPNIQIMGAAFDEGWNFACGIKIGDGDCVILDAPNDHMDQLYAFVYGAWPEHDDEDEAQPIEHDELPTPARVLEDLTKAKEAKKAAVAAE